MLKVLIIDDQPAVRTALETLFELHGLSVLCTGTPEEALNLLQTEDIGAVVQDMNFTQNTTTGEEGVALFRSIRELDPDMPVLLMTAFASLETAVQLIKEGAADYMAKPWNDDKLLTTVRNLVSLRALRQENVRLRARSARSRRELAERYDLRGVIYASDAMHEVVRLAVTVAASDAPVLITGPNGSGKEKLAEIIQANSRRRDKAFVKVNVGALPDGLFEAELFGAEAGAYTGAAKVRVGRFETATGGTLFLDELGTLSLASQAKLLRVLQTGEYERLGSSGTRKADARVVAATNVNLPRAIEAGMFREDLYFRINVIELQVPPLADRAEDILPLAEHFLASYAHKEAKNNVRLGDGARLALINYDWPGNVRELQNRIQRAVLVAAGNVITEADLGVFATHADRGNRSAAPRPATEVEASVPAPINDDERRQIEEALGHAAGVVSRAAAELGLSRQALYRRMERLGITLERRIK
ncbi:MAG: sigma-54 dependent transcriptional regulator [Deltaproteobacteria bacterium]|nr:sigma-54 dependent transcriptional regulator [Deltaproteobacteria bacterium]